MKNKEKLYYLHGVHGLEMSTGDGVSVCKFDKTKGYIKRKEAILNALNSYTTLKATIKEQAELIERNQVIINGLYEASKVSKHIKPEFLIKLESLILSNAMALAKQTKENTQ